MCPMTLEDWEAQHRRVENDIVRRVVELQQVGLINDAPLEKLVLEWLDLEEFMAGGHGVEG